MERSRIRQKERKKEERMVSIGGSSFVDPIFRIMLILFFNYFSSCDTAHLSQQYQESVGVADI